MAICRGASIAALLVVLALAAASGCEQSADFWVCNPYNSAPSSTCPEPADAGSGGAGNASGGLCDGRCIPLGPLGWTLPALVWLGPHDFVPACPAEAPTIGYEGIADLASSGACDTCTCDPPVGSCLLPAKLTANSKICAGGGVETPFNPPSGWSGACTTSGAIPAGKLCNGSPCVASLTIGPLLTTQGPSCAPKPIKGPGLGTTSYLTFGRACIGTPFNKGSCNDPAMVCSPASVPPPSGFKQCIFQKGGPLPCPASYPAQHVLYEGSNDLRTCTPCDCGPPEGSACSSTISVYSDGVCGAMVLSIKQTSGGPLCDDLQPGTALGSRSATPPVFQPGTCLPSGGDIAGTVTPVGPSTFCCEAG